MASHLRKSSIKARVIDGCFLLYKLVLSPILWALGTPARGCRYPITCSEYAAWAFETQSFSKALALSLRRILSCNPWTLAQKDHFST